MLKTNDIDAGMQRHLARVYAAVALNVAVAAGAVWALLTFPALAAVPQGLWTAAAFCLLLALAFTTTNKAPSPARLALFAAFGAVEGFSLAPFVGYIADVDPQLLLLALTTTVTTFLSFSGAALLSKRRSWLYLGGALGGLVSYMFLAALANGLFLRSLLLEVGIWCAYLVYDTQVIVERAAGGPADYVNDAVLLFLDAVALFVRIAALLAKNREEREEERQREGRKRGERR